jgi:hypothetical protein
LFSLSRISTERPCYYNTFRVQIGDEQVRVMSDRVSRPPYGKQDYSALTPAVTPPSNDTSKNSSRVNANILPGSQRPKKKVCCTLPRPEAEHEYVFECFADEQSDDAGQPLHRIRWMGTDQGRASGNLRGM